MPKATDEQLGKLSRQWNALFAHVQRGQVDSGKTSRALHCMTMGKFEDISSETADLFCTAEEQLETFRRINDKYGLGFGPADFKQLGSPPAWPEKRLHVVVLEALLNTVEETFCKTSAVFDDYDFVVRSIKVPPNTALCVDQQHLRLLHGIQHCRSLRWRVINLTANTGKCVGQVRDPQLSPHAALLWAAIYFSGWLGNMNGRNIPYVGIAGYEINPVTTELGLEPWSLLPTLYFESYPCHEDWGPELCLNPIQGTNQKEYAVPEFVLR